MAKNVSKITLLAAAAFMLAYLPACSSDDDESDSSSVAVTGVTVSPDKATLYVSGDDGSNTVTLTATVAPENATDKTVTWLSSNTGVAAVSAETGSEITVTAKSAGVATLTAKAADDKTATVQLTVFADRASEVMFKSIAGTTYKVGEQSVSIDEFGFVTVGGKKSDKPAVFDGSKLTVIIDGTSHEITVKDDNLTFDGTTGKKLKPTLTKNNDEPQEYDTIKAAFAAIPTTGTDTYTITLQPGTYSESGLSYNGSATVVIAGETTAKYGKDVVIMGKGSSQTDSKSRCLLYVDGTANIVLKNVTLQNTLKRSDPDIPTKDGNPLTQAEAFGFGSSGTVTAYNASFLSHQDTVRTVGKAWFYQCYFEGDVDFLWMETSGQVALYENCEIKMVGDETNKAYVAAPGLAQTSPVGKGLVIYNSKVIIDSQVTDAYLARTPWTENKYNQVAYINTTVDGTLKAVWAGAPIATEFPKTDIGWKLCPVTAVACKHTGADVLSARMTAREYNGRYVILNRVFDTKTKKYKTAETLWDAAKGLGVTGIPDDASKNNIFLDYADVTKTSIGDELVVTDFNGKATSVTWSVKAFRKYENGALSDPVDGLTIADGKVTSSLTGNFYAEVTAKKGDASDSIILYNVTATAISLSQTAVSIAEGSDVQLTAAFEPDGADAEVVWTSSDPAIATVEDGKVIAQSGKAGSTATITATIKDTDIKATCEVTVTEAVLLKKFGTSVAGASSTNYNTIGTGEYLLYPVPIKAGEAYAIEAKITYTTVANIGAGIVAFKDGAYSDGVVSRVAFATPAGVKSTAGGQGYSANNTESDGEYIVKAYTKQDSENLFFSLTTPNDVELTKDYTMSYYVPAETDSIYLAIGGMSNGGASVSANDITITVGDAAPAKVAKFEDLAADTRTVLSVGGTVSYTIAATETSANGTKFSIPLAADMLKGLTISPNAEGTWSWDATTIETPNGKDIAATATFIPADRAQYKAVISREVTIAVTDNRATSNATFVTIKCFESNGTIANATATGGDDKIKASDVVYVGLDVDSSNAERFASVGSGNGTKDFTKFYYVKLTVDGSVSVKLTAFEGKGSHAGSTNNLTIEYYLATSLPDELTDEVVKGWTSLGTATKRVGNGDIAKFSTETPISGDVYIVAFPSAQASAYVGPGPMTIDVSYE